MSEDKDILDEIRDEVRRIKMEYLENLSNEEYNRLTSHQLDECDCTEDCHCDECDCYYCDDDNWYYIDGEPCLWHP